MGFWVINRTYMWADSHIHARAAVRVKQALKHGSSTFTQERGLKIQHIERAALVLYLIFIVRPKIPLGRDLLNMQLWFRGKRSPPTFVLVFQCEG